MTESIFTESVFESVSDSVTSSLLRATKTTSGLMLSFFKRSLTVPLNSISLCSLVFSRKTFILRFLVFYSLFI